MHNFAPVFAHTYFSGSIKTEYSRYSSGGSSAHFAGLTIDVGGSGHYCCGAFLRHRLSTYFPWATALLTGALLSATDPSSVVQVLKQARPRSA